MAIVNGFGFIFRALMPRTPALPTLAVPEILYSRYHSQNFDRGANACSLHPAPRALASIAYAEERKQRLLIKSSGGRCIITIPHQLSVATIGIPIVNTRRTRTRSISSCRLLSTSPKMMFAINKWLCCIGSTRPKDREVSSLCGVKVFINGRVAMCCVHTASFSIFSAPSENMAPAAQANI